MALDSEHEGLPVPGYVSQSAANVSAVAENKRLEERVLRRIEVLAAAGTHDPRMLALGRTAIQEAFMWINRAVFQPVRVRLPEDETDAP